MQTDDGPSRVPQRTVVPAPGGTVEPANRAPIAIDRFQTPIEVPTERFELRDPFAELTYRAKTFSDMAAKADQLGSSRFTAIDAQGRRTPVHKIDGQWQTQATPEAERAVQQLANASIASPAATAKAARSHDTEGPTATAALQPKATAPADPAADRSLARIDAQAERNAMVARLEAALVERYLIKRAPVTVGDLTIGRTEYRFRGDNSRVAFTESTFRLATDTNSPSVARSMVDVAQARNWRALRVSGNEDFRRLVWLEASARGVKTLGYEPLPADLEVLKREREGRAVNRIEPEREAGRAAAEAVPADKSSARGGGGRKTVLAAIEAVLVAKRVPAKQREAVITAAAEKLAQRQREGQPLPKVKLYDMAAPSQRPVTVPTPEVQRTRERAAPTR